MLEVTSSAFAHDEAIPQKYTHDGEGISPPLAWKNIPEDAKSIAVLVEDPDAPRDEPFLHWLVTDLPPTMQHVDAGAALPHDANVTESDAGTHSYFGPNPPSGVHHYHFHVYALDTVIGRRAENRADFLDAIEGHVLDEGELVGTYTHPS